MCDTCIAQERTLKCKAYVDMIKANTFYTNPPSRDNTRKVEITSQNVTSNLKLLVVESQAENKMTFPSTTDMRATSVTTSRH